MQRSIVVLFSNQCLTYKLFQKNGDKLIKIEILLSFLTCGMVHRGYLRGKNGIGKQYFPMPFYGLTVINFIRMVPHSTCLERSG
jgi:hypothetical protein